MRLYEIDAELDELLSNVDEDTGELLIDAEAIDALMAQRQTVLEDLACEVKNLAAYVAALRTEEIALAERRKRLDKKAERLKGYLEAALNGEKLDTPRVVVSFIKSKAVEVGDEFFPWAAAHAEYLRYSDPEPDKKAITDALKRGEDIPGAQMVERVSMKIK